MGKKERAEREKKLDLDVEYQVTERYMHNILGISYMWASLGATDNQSPLAYS